MLINQWLKKIIRLLKRIWVVVWSRQRVFEVTRLHSPERNLATLVRCLFPLVCKNPFNFLTARNDLCAFYHSTELLLVIMFDNATSESVSHLSLRGIIITRSSTVRAWPHARQVVGNLRNEFRFVKTFESVGEACRNPMSPIATPFQ